MYRTNSDMKLIYFITRLIFAALALGGVYLLYDYIFAGVLC